MSGNVQVAHTHRTDHSAGFLPLSFKFLIVKSSFKITILHLGGNCRKCLKLCSEPQPLSFHALVSCLVFDPGINYRQSPRGQARLNRAIFGHLEWRRKRTKTKMYKLIMNICRGETVCHSSVYWSS